MPTEITFEQLPKRVINLAHRTDRLKRFRMEISSIQMKSLVYHVPGIITEQQVSKGIGMSHVVAMDSGEPITIVFEDDAIFPGRHKTIPHIDECLKNAPEDWDILLGGALNLKVKQQYNEHWDVVEDFRGLQFYMIKKSAVERVKNEYKFNDHIDKWISEAGFKVYIMRTVVCMQNDGYSDNVKYNTKYYTLYSKRFNILKP
jgi:hypothetical protein